MRLKQLNGPKAEDISSKTNKIRKGNKKRTHQSDKRPNSIRFGPDIKSREENAILSTGE